MNLQKCTNGHFFDADKYQTCPHCQTLNDDVKTVGKFTGIQSEHVFSQTPAMPRTAPAVPQTPPAAPSMTPDDDAKTIGIFQTNSEGTRPVVGWLVCVKGSNKGKSFQLREGKNFIGRGEDMDVVIRGDMAVARKCHAILIYEPKASVFYAQPGDSHELFYLNDNVVLNSEILKEKDVLTLGETSLLFVPLCGPDFSWNDYKEEK